MAGAGAGGGDHACARAHHRQRGRGGEGGACAGARAVGGTEEQLAVLIVHGVIGVGCLAQDSDGMRW